MRASEKISTCPRRVEAADLSTPSKERQETGTGRTNEERVRWFAYQGKGYRDLADIRGLGTDQTMVRLARSLSARVPAKPEVSPSRNVIVHGLGARSLTTAARSGRLSQRTKS